MYKIEFKSSVKKEMKRISKPMQLQILERFNQLQENPKHYGKPLFDNLKGLYSSRVRDCRIIYKIKEEKLEILVVKVGHRKKVYKER